jgi:hypothetical protein
MLRGECLRRRKLHPAFQGSGCFIVRRNLKLGVAGASSAVAPTSCLCTKSIVPYTCFSRAPGVRPNIQRIKERSTPFSSYASRMDFSRIATARSGCPAEFKSRYSGEIGAQAIEVGKVRGPRLAERPTP